MTTKVIEKRYTMSWLPLLGILFIGLKLTDHIDWSWLWVLAPFWLPLGVVLGFIALLLLFALVVWAIER